MSLKAKVALGWLKSFKYDGMCSNKHEVRAGDLYVLTRGGMFLCEQCLDTPIEPKNYSNAFCEQCFLELPLNHESNICEDCAND